MRSRVVLGATPARQNTSEPAAALATGIGLQKAFATGIGGTNIHGALIRTGPGLQPIGAMTRPALSCPGSPSNADTNTLTAVHER